MTSGRIVVIDDCRLTLAMARDMLEDAGYEVLTAESGIEANPHIFGHKRPDLLLIDVELPMLRGDRKVRLLKESKNSRDIPTILMSHKAPQELQTLAQKAGADGWIAKPLRSDILVETIRRLLQGSSE